MKETEALQPVSDESEQGGEHARWVQEIMYYEKDAQKWEDKGKKILRRYKDERTVHEEKPSRYNILWANVQTLAPALYARNPKPDIERRYKQKDNLSRITAQILERSVTYFVDTDPFERSMQDAVLDRLLPGRGTVWVRYEPQFRDAKLQGNEEILGEGTQLTDDVYAEPEATMAEELYFEKVCFDYVHWQDFGHTTARTVSEMRAVWRKVYLTREELVERFGDKGRSVPLDYAPKNLRDEKINDYQKKATVYEIWNKPNKTVYWLHKDYPKLLDKRYDPLELWDFFPCPPPLLATTGNDTIIPVPDYVEYQDQARELDQTTSRISSIIKSLKVAGVYDASAEGVQRLLAEGVENQLIPVEQWAVLGEKGGLKGVMELMPMLEIAQTLQTLYEVRERIKQDLYEITGIADIIRGQSDPNETLGAQQLKGQYASLRLSRLQADVQRFARDLVRIASQIIANHFSLDTIKKISGVQLFTMQEKQQIQMQQQMAQQQAQQMAQQTGQPPAPPPPLSEEQEEMMQNPTWEEVEELLRDDTMLSFRIDIETDSTIKQDEELEKQHRTELLQAVAGFIQQAATVQDPTLQVLMAELLGFGVRGFKAGKQIEGAVQMAIDKIQQQAKNPAPPPPNPEEVKAKAALEQKQLEIQANQQQAQQQMMLEREKEQMKLQTQAQQMQMQAELDLQKSREKLASDMELQKYKIDSETAHKRELALIEKALQPQEIEEENQEAEGISQLISTVKEAMEAFAKQKNSPRDIQLIRDANGNAMGARVMTVE